MVHLNIDRIKRNTFSFISELLTGAWVPYPDASIDVPCGEQKVADVLRLLPVEPAIWGHQLGLWCASAKSQAWHQEVAVQYDGVSKQFSAIVV